MPSYAASLQPATCLFVGRGEVQLDSLSRCAAFPSVRPRPQGLMRTFLSDSVLHNHSAATPAAVVATAAAAAEPAAVGTIAAAAGGAASVAALSRRQLAAPLAPLPEAEGSQ